MNEIFIFRLTDSTELIAESTSAEGVHFLKDILQIGIQYDESGRAQMGLMDFMPYSDTDTEKVVPATSVVCIAKPGKDLLEHYKKRFSKIILPDTKIVS